MPAVATSSRKISALKQPQLALDFLLPAGREKLRLDEVAKILSADDGRPPVSVTSILNGMQAGRIFGNRIPFSAPVGEEQRIRVQWMTRADVLQALLDTRTSSPEAQLDHLVLIAARLPAEALDELLRTLTALRSNKPLNR